MTPTSGRPYWRYEHPLPDDLRVPSCGRNNRERRHPRRRALHEHPRRPPRRHRRAQRQRRLGRRGGRLPGRLQQDGGAAHREGPGGRRASPAATFGTAGFLDAYDAAQRRPRVTRTYTIPGPDHPDNRTWLGDSWRTGGSPTWITGSYDPELIPRRLGHRQPRVDDGSEVRLGDNLYGDSVLALDGDTGEMSWYFQFTPHDVHDWDAIRFPCSPTSSSTASRARAMLWANRNGFYYTLDLETGEFRSSWSRSPCSKNLGGGARRERPPHPASSACSPRPTARWWPRRPVAPPSWWSPVLQPAHRAPLRQLVRRRGRVLPARRGLRGDASATPPAGCRRRCRWTTTAAPSAPSSRPAATSAGTSR